VHLALLLAWIPLLLAGGFRACVEKQPPNVPYPDPSWVSRRSDQAWRALGIKLVAGFQERKGDLHQALLAEIRALPPGSVDPPSEREAETTTVARYGRLPEVLVDQDAGAIFPTRPAPPSRFSWYQVSQRAADTLRGLAQIEQGLERLKNLAPAEKVARIGSVLAAWEKLDHQEATLAHHLRYLETWIPRLWK
jgi:hypothetical protein